MIDAQTSFKKFEFIQTRKYTDTASSSLTPFKVAKISVSWKVFTFEGIIIKWYLSEKLNAKNIEKSDKLYNKIQLAAPRYKGLSFPVVVSTTAEWNLDITNLCMTKSLM